MDEDLDRHLRHLMRAAQGGDKPAYDRLLRELTPIIRRTVYRQRGFLPQEDKEDLVQDVLLSVHSVRSTYDPKRPFMPWLMSILRNRLADKGRQHVRAKKVERAAGEFHETFPAAAANRLEEGYGDAEALRAAVKELPKGQRQAIELVKLQEMSLKEASQHSGTTVGALKVSIHRAVKALQTRLKKEEEG